MMENTVKDKFATNYFVLTQNSLLGNIAAFYDVYSECIENIWESDGGPAGIWTQGLQLRRLVS